MLVCDRCCVAYFLRLSIRTVFSSRRSRSTNQLKFAYADDSDGIDCLFVVDVALVYFFQDFFVDVIQSYFQCSKWLWVVKLYLFHFCWF